MKVFGGVFVVIGLFFVAGRFFADAWLRQRTRYAITDKRILVVRAPPYGKVAAMPLAAAANASLSERADGRGTIRFGLPMPVWGRMGSMTGLVPSLDPTPQFLAIDDSRGVFQQVQRAAEASRER
jgi:hypothetical protein